MKYRYWFSEKSDIKNKVWVDGKWIEYTEMTSCGRKNPTCNYDDMKLVHESDTASKIRTDPRIKMKMK